MASSENNLPGINKMSAQEKEREENSPIITSSSKQFSLLAEQYPDSTEDEDEESKSSTEFTGENITEATEGRQLSEDVVNESNKGRQPGVDSVTEKSKEGPSEDVTISIDQGKQPMEDVTVETNKGRELPTGETDDSITSSVNESKEGTTSGFVSSSSETIRERGDSKLTTDTGPVSENVTSHHSKETERKVSQPFLHNVVSARPPIHSLISSSETVASDQNNKTLPQGVDRSSAIQSESSLHNKDDISRNSESISSASQSQNPVSIPGNVAPASTTSNLSSVSQIINKDPNVQSINPSLASSCSSSKTSIQESSSEDLITTENVATFNPNETITTSNLTQSTDQQNPDASQYVKPVSAGREISQVVNPILDQSRHIINENARIQVAPQVGDSNTDGKISSSTSVIIDHKSSIAIEEAREITTMDTEEQVTSSSEESKRDHKESGKQDDQANIITETESRSEEIEEANTTQIQVVLPESESKSCTNENDALLDKHSKKELDNTFSIRDDLSTRDELSALGNQEIHKEQELSALDANDSLEEEMDVDYGKSTTETRDVTETTKIGETELTENVSNFGPEIQEKQKELRAFKVDPENKIIETEMMSNKDKKFTEPSVDSPASIDTSEDSQFSAEVVNSPASVVNSKMRTAVNIFRETAMDGEADTSMDLPTFDTPLGTPISMLASDTNDNPEETNMSVISTDAGPTPSKRPRQTSLGSAVEELDQHIITVDRLYEYQWPQDGGEWHMLQEQVSEYLNVKSFKRKYPDMYRRFVDKEEKEFLMDRGVVTETLCDLGLTAIRSDEVFDLMYKDYPDKYQEYAAFMHGKQRQTIYEQHKEYDVPKLEKSKMADYMKKAVKSAVDFNQQLQRDRKEERRAFFDMQTFHIHYPEGKYKKLPANLTKPSAYPIALIPGQFQHYYTKYTPDELKYLPINTAMYDAPKRMMPAQKVISNTPSEMEDSQEEKTASSDGESDGSSDSGSNSDVEDEKKKADPVKETTCRRCEKKNKNKKRPRKVKEEIINCSECGAGGHPTCLELTTEMVEVIQTYPWQCMECKTCVECMDPYDEDKMMFCDRCDRGYHTFCVGVKAIPTGRWECKSCKVTTETPKSRRGNRN